MGRKPLNRQGKATKILKCYMDETQYQEVEQTAIELNLGLSDILKLAWCEFKKSRKRVHRNPQGMIERNKPGKKAVSLAERMIIWKLNPFCLLKN